MMLQERIQIVIRSANERTIHNCFELLGKVVPPSQIHVIEEAPFSKAVSCCLQIAMESKFEWVACVDADVLISPTQTLNFFDKINSVSPKVFCLQSLILDKFFFIARPSGIHMYRTAFANKAMKFIPTEGTSLRPESFMLTSMARSGFPYQQHGIIVGIHDYEQYYCDIYRKCFLQARKHARHIDDVIKHWEELSKTDFDFRVALAGLNHGKNFVGEVLVDKDFLKAEIEFFLRANNIQEKSTHSRETLDVDSILNTFNNSSEWKALQEKMYPYSRWNELVDQNYLNNVRSDSGIKKRFLTKVSSGLKKIKSLLPR